MAKPAFKKFSNSTLYHNYGGTAAWAVGPEIRAVLLGLVSKWAAEYAATVAKDTGELSRSSSARTGVYVGEMGALTGYVTVEAGHILPHEFGWTDKLGFQHPGSHELFSILGRASN